MLIVRALALVLTMAPATQASAKDPAPEVLTIGSDLTYPPYTYLQGDQAAGFDPAFMRRLAAKMGMKPKFVDTRFPNLVLGVNARRFDVIASALYVTAERSKQVDYLPYLKTGGSLITLKSRIHAPKTPMDLCGKKVSSVLGSAWIPKLHELTKQHCVPTGKGAIDVREFEASPGATQALLAGAVDVQFEDAAVAKMTVNKLGDRLRITSPDLIYPVVVGLAVAKGNAELLRKLQFGFAALKHSGEYQALLTEYNLKEPSSQDVAQALGQAAK